MDVYTAFLHGGIDEERYMKQPKGFVIPGKERLVCKLKQASRQWYKTFDAFMLKLHCLYTNRDENGSPIILVLYADDIIIAAKKRSTVDALKKQLKSAFSVKDLGAAEHALE